jgi:23S rRNA pseudouridine1911/1915/1917 synthase
MTDQAAISISQSWSVPAEFSGARLDNFLRHHLPHLSRRVIDQALGEKLFLVNGKAGRKGDTLKDADSVSFCGPALWLGTVPPSNATLRVPIVYEDECLLALDKPAGMATHGFSARDADTLANFLMDRLPEQAQIGQTPWEAGIVHRLDRETSGLVLAAKTAATHAQLRQQFRRRAIAKRYWALVWGEVPFEGKIDYAMAHDPGDERKMAILIGDPDRRKKIKSWPALTQYHRLQCRAGVSLVALYMQTGVTHQLRVHLAAIGHPIIGDRLYAADHQESFGLARQFLHAIGLELLHPRDGRTLQLEAALPTDLAAVLARLGIAY